MINLTYYLLVAGTLLVVQRFCDCGEYLLDELRQHQIQSTIRTPLLYLQEDITRPGTFIAIQFKYLVEITTNSSYEGGFSPVTVITPKIKFDNPTSFYQQGDSILVINRRSRCITTYHRTSGKLTLHSGLCDPRTGKGTPKDGPLKKARYLSPFDIASPAGQQSQLYVTDGVYLRLIDISQKTLVTLYHEKTLSRLGRVAFTATQIIISGEGGIRFLSNEAHSSQNMLSFNDTTDAYFDVTLYDFDSIVPLSRDLMLAVRIRPYPTLETYISALAVIDLKNERATEACTVDNSFEFCRNQTLRPGYLTVINNTLYITEATITMMSYKKIIRINTMNVNECKAATGKDNSAINQKTGLPNNMSNCSACTVDIISLEINPLKHPADCIISQCRSPHLRLDHCDRNTDISQVTNNTELNAETKAKDNIVYYATLPPSAIILILISAALLAILRRQKKQRSIENINLNRALPTPPHHTLQAPENIASLSTNPPSDDGHCYSLIYDEIYESIAIPENCYKQERIIQLFDMDRRSDIVGSAYAGDVEYVRETDNSLSKTDESIVYVDDGLYTVR